MALGIAAGQVALFAPSLAGQKLLLPLDYLARPQVYLPDGSLRRSIIPQNPVLSDQVLSFEFMRRFATQEIRAGRLPLWNPGHYAGAPAAIWAKYSPFNLLYYVFPAPVTLAWMQLLKSLLAGFGAYVFFRRVLRLGFDAAAAGAWLYPLTGYFVLWQGYPASFVTAWYPWMLLATDRAVVSPRGWAGPALAALTGLTLISGQADVAAQVLLGSGLYAAWPLLREYRGRLLRGGSLAVAVLVSAWALGVALASPYLLPLAEYSQTGWRIQERAAGKEERPPVGLRALPETILPNIHGSYAQGSVRIAPGNHLNGAAGAYTGLLAALLLAPLGLCSRPQRGASATFLLLGLFSLSWLLNLPGMTALLRLPGLNMLSHNRMVFLAGFSCLALAVLGLQVLVRPPPHLRRWAWAPAVALAALAGWWLFRSIVLPEVIASGLQHAVNSGKIVPGDPELFSVAAVQRSYSETYRVGSLLGGLAMAAWLVLWLRSEPARWLRPLCVALLAAELLWFGRDLNPQTDPALYYPTIPALAELAQAPPGRVLCIACLPARLAESHGLRDIRGYDGVDPARLMQLLRMSAHPLFEGDAYAYSQHYVPRFESAPPSRVEISPIIDMLNVRYLIYRGQPHAGFEPFMAGDDYWVVENPRALPRLNVPERVLLVPEARTRLAMLADKSFDPRQLALVETPVDLPADTRQRGHAQIVSERPSQLRIAADMQTPGLIVLADLWDPGWRAQLDGRPVPVLRVNHALRGIVVPEGRSQLELRYRPASVTAGFWLAAAATGALALWSVPLFGTRRPRDRTGGFDLRPGDPGERARRRSLLPEPRTEGSAWAGPVSAGASRSHRRAIPRHHGAGLTGEDASFRALGEARSI